jgi:hypothetical protein
LVVVNSSTWIRSAYTWDGLKGTVPRVLKSTEQMKIWKWYKKGARIIQTYREGITYGTEEFRVRYYKSHRRIKA